MKNIYIIVVLVFITAIGYTQQDAQYTQYMYNTITVNPAYAGSRGALSFVGLHRSQWVGLEGAPRTQTFSANTPFRNSRVGLGVSFVNDALGPTSEQHFNVDFSYTIPFEDDKKLSFGMKGTASVLGFDKNKLNPEHQSDLYLENFSRFNPNFGVGVYYHTKKFYLGLSSPQIFNSKHFDENDVSFGKERTNFYVIGGYVFNLTESLKFKPAVLSKMVYGAPLQLDASANFMYNDKFIFGAAYRWSAAASLLAGFQVNRQLMIGYAYDFDTSKLAKYNGGSHEIMLRFELFNRKENVDNPRFF